MDLKILIPSEILSSTKITINDKVLQYSTIGRKTKPSKGTSYTTQQPHISLTDEIPPNIKKYINQVVSREIFIYEADEARQHKKIQKLLDDNAKREEIRKIRLARQRESNKLSQENLATRTRIQTDKLIFKQIKDLRRQVEEHSKILAQLLNRESIDESQIRNLNFKLQSFQSEINEHDNLSKMDKTTDKIKPNWTQRASSYAVGVGSALNSGKGSSSVLGLLAAGLGPLGMAIPALAILAPFAKQIVKVVRSFYKFPTNLGEKIYDFFSKKPGESDNLRDKINKSDKFRETAEKTNKANNERMRSERYRKMSDEVHKQRTSKVDVSKMNFFDYNNKPETKSVPKANSFSKLSNNLKSFGETAYNKYKGTASTTNKVLEKAKELASKTFRFFNKMSSNPKLREKFITKLALRIGQAKVMSFMIKIGIATTGFGILSLAFAIYDLVDSASDVLEVIDEIEKEESAMGDTIISTTEPSFMTSMYQSARGFVGRLLGEPDQATLLTGPKETINTYNYSPNATLKSYGGSSPSFGNMSTTTKSTGTSTPSTNLASSIRATPASLVELIKQNEASGGFFPTYYKDAKGMSIGYGHYSKGPGSIPVKDVLGYDPPNDTINQAEADKLLQYDIQRSINGLYAAYPWAESQPEKIRNHLIDMTYNLGVGGIKEFDPTLTLIRDGQYEQAAERLTKTLWYTQVGSRAIRIVNDLRQQGKTPITDEKGKVTEGSKKSTEGYIQNLPSNKPTTDLSNKKPSENQGVSGVSGTPGANTSGQSGSAIKDLFNKVDTSKSNNVESTPTEQTTQPVSTTITNQPNYYLTNVVKNKESNPNSVQNIQNTQNIQNNILGSMSSQQKEIKGIPSIHKDSFS